MRRKNTVISIRYQIVQLVSCACDSDKSNSESGVDVARKRLNVPGSKGACRGFQHC
jgi:hypothetical protein